MKDEERQSHRRLGFRYWVRHRDAQEGEFGDEAVFLSVKSRSDPPGGLCKHSFIISPRRRQCQLTGDSKGLFTPRAGEVVMYYEVRW